MLCNGSRAVFRGDKDRTADKNSKVQSEFGNNEKVRSESSTMTHNLKRGHFLLCLPHWETAARPRLFPGGFDGFFPSEEAMTPWL